MTTVITRLWNSFAAEIWKGLQISEKLQNAVRQASQVVTVEAQRIGILIGMQRIKVRLPMRGKIALETELEVTCSLCLQKFCLIFLPML